MFRIMLTVIAGSLFYGLSASLCFAGLFRIHAPSACTAICLTYNRGLRAIDVKNHAKSFQIADISPYTHFL